MIDTAGIMFGGLNAVLRLILLGMVVMILIQRHEAFSRLERGGLGLMGGSAFMTIPVVLDINASGTPFDDWATCLLPLGCVVFIAGRWLRVRAHSVRNAWAVDEARRHFEGKR